MKKTSRAWERDAGGWDAKRRLLRRGFLGLSWLELIPVDRGGLGKRRRVELPGGAFTEPLGQ